LIKSSQLRHKDKDKDKEILMKLICDFHHKYLYCSCSEIMS